MNKNRKLFFTTLAVGILAAATTGFTQEINRGSFTEDGLVMQPDYTSWIHVGGTVTPDELNSDSAIYFPEFHQIYIEPSAFAYFKEHGEWPAGTQIVKQRTLLRDGDNCSKENGACTEASGTGYFEGKFKGFEYSVKDAERFPDEPGGWVYYSFGNDGKPFAKTAKPFPTASCNACHQAVAETDFVFTQFYPVLRDAKKDN